MEATATRPMRAEIVQSRYDETLACVDIFGMAFFTEFGGNNHRERAEAWVLGWNKHLDREWALIKASGAEVMERFVDALQDASVPRGDIETAIRSLLEHAKR